MNNVEELYVLQLKAVMYSDHSDGYLKQWARDKSAGIESEAKPSLQQR
jgi:hypothetical protein